MASDRAAVLRAAQRYGASVDHIASRYVNPITGHRLTGAALLAKIVSGESSFNRNSVSPVGARGLAQFMPSSRAEAIRRFGVDPWRSPDEAVHAAALHLRGKINGSTGLEGYNPGGGQGYVDYILRQRVGSVGGSPTRSASGTSKGGSSAGTPDSSPSLADRLSQLPSVQGQGVELQQGPIVQASPLTPPAFAAKAVTPQGFQTAQGTSVQPPQEIQLPDATPASIPTIKEPKAPATPSASAAGAVDGGARGSRVRGTFRGSPVPGQKPQRSSHETAGLPGYPAYDYMAKAGTTVVAPVSGTVIKRSGKDPKLGGPPGGPLGYSVYIKGTDGKIYYLTHIDRVRPKVGQRVRQGQKIAVIANGPASWSSPHVHMGVHG